MMLLEKLTSWADVGAGRFGIPQDATHFRWKNATASRDKMCDGGNLFSLDDPTDRPPTRPGGMIRVYPFIVTGTGAEAKVVPCVLAPGLGDTDPRTWVQLEFAREQTSDVSVMSEMMKLLAKQTELAAKPSEVLTGIIEQQQKTIAQQAEYISEHEGGAISRFLNSHPEIVKQGIDLAFKWGEQGGKILLAKAEVAVAEARVRTRQLQTDGGIDVTPKQGT